MLDWSGIRGSSFFSLIPFLMHAIIVRADTLYLCYCIDKASGEKRREEVFIAFEYDLSRTDSRRPQDSVGTRRRPSTPQGKGRETMFDAGPSASTTPRKVLPATVPQHRQFPQGQRRTVPLSSPYVAAEYDEMTPTLTPSGKGATGKGPVNVNELPIREEEEEEEDLDPFRRSLVDDEEAQVAVATRVGVGVNNNNHNTGMSGHVARPSLVSVGLGHGHGKAGSGGGTVVAMGAAGGQMRMMTSTQELNMKSQFLMNMRPYGVQDSQASGTESTSASARFGLAGSGVGSGTGSGMVKDDGNEDSLSEGEESQLGPGSDFFK